MRLIDADALMRRFMHKPQEYFHASYIVGEINTAPTIDAVPVVRCKDCKNWDTTWQNDWAKNNQYCPNVDGIRKGDWYCADGERRTDE